MSPKYVGLNSFCTSRLIVRKVGEDAIMNKKIVLVSNIMMLRERDRFDEAIRHRGYEPVWATPEQFLSEGECLELVGEI